MACNHNKCGCTCKITGLAHIGVFVSDIVKSKLFYTEVLGFEIYLEWELKTDDGIVRLVFMRCGTCEIELVQLPDHSERTDGPIAHIALRVDDIEAMMVCLTKKCVEFETKEAMYVPDIFGNGLKHVFFRGPDGEHLELAQQL